MIIRSKRHWTDIAEGPRHPAFSRRDLLTRGLAMGTLAVALPKMFGEEFIRSAQAGTLSCNPATPNPGAIAQIFANGGPAMGARFLSDTAATAMNAAAATHYGISGGANLQKIAPGVWIDVTSPFGVALLQGPPGFVGGPQAWRNTVLSNICAGGHMGPFNLDDGAGVNSGLIGSVSLDKATQMGKDIWFNPGPKTANWANGTPAAMVSPTIASVERPFTLTPAPTNYTTGSEMSNAANGAVAISQAFSPLFGTKSRLAAGLMTNNVGCSFLGNAALTNTSLAASLFDPTTIPALSSSMTLGVLTPQELVLLSSFYQSAMGVVGGVSLTTSGSRDYHGQDPITFIAPADIEDARSIVMFLAACHTAQKPGALIYVSNGNCVATGVQAGQVTINGSQFNINAPVAAGDAGGFYNAGSILFYSPTGNLPSAKYTGSMNAKTMDGAVLMDPAIGNQNNAFAGLYLSAHQFTKGTLPPSLLARLKANAIAPASSIMVI
jgi:hypothetical protein